jgi:hypothetical protein
MTPFEASALPRPDYSHSRIASQSFHSPQIRVAVKTTIAPLLVLTTLGREPGQRMVDGWSTSPRLHPVRCQGRLKSDPFVPVEN